MTGFYGCRAREPRRLTRVLGHRFVRAIGGERGIRFRSICGKLGTARGDGGSGKQRVNTLSLRFLSANSTRKTRRPQEKVGRSGIPVYNIISKYERRRVIALTLANRANSVPIWPARAKSKAKLNSSISECQPITRDVRERGVRRARARRMYIFVIFSARVFECHLLRLPFILLNLFRRGGTHAHRVRTARPRESRDDLHLWKKELRARASFCKSDGRYRARGVVINRLPSPFQIVRAVTDRITAAKLISRT